MQHSEYNGSDKDMLHFLQIWVKPDTLGLKPTYTTKYFTDDEKKNKLRAICAPNHEELNCIKMHQDATTYASILEKGKQIEYSLKPTRKALFQLITSHPNLGIKVTAGDETVDLQGGDVLFVKESDTETKLTMEGSTDEPTEFVFFDLGK
jgi:hypothetical protein